MTPKEKAEELIFRFTSKLKVSKNDAKRGALISVDELIFDYDKITEEEVPLDFIISKMEYWEQVKTEIGKL